ncbi:MAG TPA: galactokinase family protein [Candidatus Kapabacteria bacterium]|nr:galactokinase family protein [Candidatus Kapabacteria bacterium]
MGAHEVKQFFQKSFGAPPTHVVCAPGRLELLGNHTDYNGGLVMALAVDKYIYIAASPRKDGQIELASTSFDTRETFYIDKIQKNPAAAWANYVKGVLLKLRERGVHFTGFNAAVHGTIPFGAGLSSSAALEMATALIVRALFPFRLSENGLDQAPRREDGGLPPLTPAEKLRIAKVGQAAENEFVGVKSGLLDQMSSMFGKAGHVIQIDCLHHTVQHDPMPPGVAIVVADSAVKHDLSAGEYNELREHCESAARKLGVQFLRFVDPKQLAAQKDKLTEREYQCAFHIVGENQRVVFGERALRDGDIYQFGQYLFQSHASSRDFFKNSTAELDALVDCARKIKGCYGARLTGGGFGGATINLVQADAAEEFQRRLAEEYFHKTNIRTEPWTVQVVDGAQ